jgi:uncharacterized membrane protein
MSSMRQALRRFRSDTRGNVTIIVVLFMFAAIGFVALDVDVGKVYVDRRRAQSAADLAAIVAASNISSATSAASATVQANNYPASALTSVQTGIYTANAAIAPANRFVASPAASANAVQVTVQTQTPLIFGKLFYSSGVFNVTTKATATSTALANFAIGSRLVSVNGGLLNSILGSLLGTNLSLSVMDYQSLASAQIDAFSFLSALATQANLTAVSYNQVLQSNVSVGNILRAMLATQSGGSATALNNIIQALGGSTASITPQSLISAGPYAGLPLGQSPQFGVSLGVLDLLSAVAELSNGANQVTTGVNLGLPGIASVSLTVLIGQRPQGTSWVAVGTTGATVTTAQTRVLLNIQLLGSGSVAAVTLPVYVEVAYGTATLTSLSCSHSDSAQSSVTLGVTPGIVSAWIGQINPASFNNLSIPPNPTPATLVNLGLVQVNGLATATIGNTTPTPVTFSYADIQANTVKTVTTTNYTSSLTSSLLGSLSISINGIPLLPGLGGLVTGIIGGATSSIDQLLATTFNTLGVGLGQADVWVYGIRCDGAVLVN